MDSPHPPEATLTELAEGTLAPTARPPLFAHLEACTDCRTKVARRSAEKSARLTMRATDVAHGMAPVGEDLVGTMIGEYRVAQRLGKGGMAVLYRAEHPVIGKSVAIKVMLPTIAADPEVAQRMLGEARAVNAIRHPNIVDVFAFGQLPDGRHYMVMELLEGQSLGEVLSQRGRLSVAQTLTVLSQSMAALEAAHAVGVIHRDIKPENIFVSIGADGWKVTLLDFGLAKQEGTVDEKLTRPGVVMGTPGFMAPEQVRGGEGVGTRADIYAMGVLAWTLLAGHEPFAGGSVVEVMHRQLSTQAPPLGPLVPELPQRLEALVRQMMAKDPAQRPSATEVRLAVAELMSGSADPSVPAAAAEATTVPVPAVRRRRGPVLAAVGVVGCALAGVGWYLNAHDETGATALEAQALRPIARPPPPDPQPVPPPDPVQVEAPTPEPVPERTTAMAWRCKAVNDVTEITGIVGADRKIFSVLFVDEPPVVVVSTHPGGSGLKDLQRLRKAARACRGTDKEFAARFTNSRHPGFLGKNGVVYKGVVVQADDLTVGKAAPRK